MTRRKNKVKSVVNWISAIIFIIFIAISIFLFGTVISIEIIPVKFIVPLILAYIVMCVGLGLIIINNRLKNWLKVVVVAICLLFITIFGFAIHYFNTTFDFMDNIKELGYQMEHYYVVVLDSSSDKELKDISGEVVGTSPIDSDNYKTAFKQLTDTVQFEEKVYENAISMAQELLDGTLDVIFLSGSYLDIIKEEVEGFDGNVRILHTISLKVDSEVEKIDVDVGEEPFNIYVSGVDVFGSISSVARSDVNMVVTVNPNTNKILLTSIPRDYYVQLHGTTGLKDKLTHAGIYGVNMSVETLEDLLDVDINYYIRVNFTTLMDLVDAIGGIELYSEYSFISLHGKYHFKKGINQMNGHQALCYVRERYAFRDGDRQRVKNQQALISAIIEKMTSSSTLITKYSSILNTLGKSFQTNMGSDKIYSLLNLQLDKMPSWTIENISLNGTDKKALTYSYSGGELYVMEPDMETVYAARDKIDSVMEEK